MAQLPITLSEVKRIRTPQDMEFRSCTFLYVLDGELRVSAGGEPLLHRRADLLFLPPERRIRVSSPQAQLLLFGISESFVADHISVRPLPLLMSALDPAHDYLPLKREILAASEQYRHAPEEGSAEYLALTASLYRILAELKKLLPAHAVSPGKYAQRVQDLADYIDAHYADNFSLPDLADAFFLTPQYLSSFFREHFHTNFKAYVTEKRLFYALRDLRNTSLSVSEIALKNGFSSVSAFQKNFLKYHGTTPSAYRAAYLRSGGAEAARSCVPAADADAADLPLADADEPHASTGALPAHPGELHVSCAADTEGTRFPRANRMINAGSVHNLLSDRYRLHLGTFCRETGMTHVRIEELLSNSFMPMIMPHREYYYQNADAVLSFFYEYNLVPFIELTRADQQSEALFVARNERFYRLLTAFLKHVSRRWPVSWLKEWCFELWMLPKDTPDSYADAWGRAAGIIRELLPGAAVGGPGYDPCVHRGSPSDILRALKERSLSPDFFSLTAELSELRPDGSHAIPSDPEQLLHTCRAVQDEIRAISRKLPFYVTEWTSAAPSGAPVMASRYQAAFLARTWPRLDEVADLAAYRLFDDMEHISGSASPAIVSFGRGLFGQHYAPYAAAHAVSLLTHLGSCVLAKGSCFRFVRAEAHHYQFLTWNYAHFRTSQDPDISDTADFDRVYECFEDVPPLVLSAEITGLTPGLYRLTRTLIDEDHGSILDVLIGEYTHSNIDKIDFLQTISTQSVHATASTAPLVRNSYTKSDGTLTLRAELMPHSVCFFDLRRQI